MLIRWEDRDWGLDLTDLTNRQAEALETGLKMTLAGFYEMFEGGEEDGVAAFDAARPYFLKIMTFAYWLMLDQNGVKAKITDVEFPVLRFAQAFAAGRAAEPAAQEEVKPDPTRPPAASAPSPEPSSRNRSRSVAAGSPDG